MNEDLFLPIHLYALIPIENCCGFFFSSGEPKRSDPEQSYRPGGELIKIAWKPEVFLFVEDLNNESTSGRDFKTLFHPIYDHETKRLSVSTATGQYNRIFLLPNGNFISSPFHLDAKRDHEISMSKNTLSPSEKDKMIALSHSPDLKIPHFLPLESRCIGFVSGRAIITSSIFPYFSIETAPLSFTFAYPKGIQQKGNSSKPPSSKWVCDRGGPELIPLPSKISEEQRNISTKGIFVDQTLYVFDTSNDHFHPLKVIDGYGKKDSVDLVQRCDEDFNRQTGEWSIWKSSMQSKFTFRINRSIDCRLFGLEWDNETTLRLVQHLPWMKDFQELQDVGKFGILLRDFNNDYILYNPKTKTITALTVQNKLNKYIATTDTENNTNIILEYCEGTWTIFKNEDELKNLEGQPLSFYKDSYERDSEYDTYENRIFSNLPPSSQEFYIQSPTERRVRTVYGIKEGVPNHFCFSIVAGWESPDATLVSRIPSCFQSSNMIYLKHLDDLADYCGAPIFYKLKNHLPLQEHAFHSGCFLDMEGELRTSKNLNLGNALVDKNMISWIGVVVFDPEISIDDALESQKSLERDLCDALFENDTFTLESGKLRISSNPTDCNDTRKRKSRSSMLFIDGALTGQWSCKVQTRKDEYDEERTAPSQLLILHNSVANDPFYSSFYQPPSPPELLTFRMQKTSDTVESDNADSNEWHMYNWDVFFKDEGPAVMDAEHTGLNAKAPDPFSKVLNASRLMEIKGVGQRLLFSITVRPYYEQVPSQYSEQLSRIHQLSRARNWDRMVYPFGVVLAGGYRKTWSCHTKKKNEKIVAIALVEESALVQ